MSQFYALVAAILTAFLLVINRPIIQQLSNWMNPFIVRVMGANINRSTVEYVKRAALEIERIKHLGPLQVVKLMIGKPRIIKTQSRANRPTSI